MGLKKKSTENSLRIWKTISNRVRIVETEKGQYEVQTRHLLGLFSGLSEWYTLNTFSTMKAALKRKHSFIVMILMRDLGYRNEFVARRTERKKRLGLI